MCVCKQWCAAIRDPKFVESHRNHSQARLGGNYLVTFWYYRDAIAISFKDHQGRCRVPPPIHLKLKSNPEVQNVDLLLRRPTFDRVCSSQTLDGLVCLFSRYNHQAVVLNLATRQIIHLPQTFFRDCFLGFDPLTGEYKVLNLNSRSDFQRRSEIFSLGSADPLWRKTMDPPPPLVPNYRSDACVNGAIYWLIPRGNQTLLIAFDVGREVYRTLRLAENFGFGTEWLHAAGGGRLACIQSVSHPNNGACSREIWLLEGFGGDDDNLVSVADKIPILANSMKYKWTYFIHSGSSPKGELVLLDSRSSRSLYVDLEEKTVRDKGFKWPHPRKEEKDKRLRSLLYRERYGHVENLYRFKVVANSRNLGGCFFVEE